MLVQLECMNFRYDRSFE